MRIGTWNVEYGFGKRNPDRFKIISETHPADIWVLTETHSSLDLSETHPYSLTTLPRPNRRTGSSWVTIWSRFPLQSQHPVPDSCRMVAGTFDTLIGPLTLAGVVLPWHSDVGDLPPEPRPGNWSEHRRVLRDELPLLLQNLRTERPNAHLTLAGDLNIDLTRPHSYGYAEGRIELKKILAEHSLVCHTSDTLYPPAVTTRAVKSRTLIDHICSDLGSAESIETWPGIDGVMPRLSDHPGVVATFTT